MPGYPFLNSLLALINIIKNARISIVARHEEVRNARDVRLLEVKLCWKLRTH